MITSQDFAMLMVSTQNNLSSLIIDYMTSYSKAGVKPREPFTERVLEMLKILINNPYNPSGSFTKEGAMEALSEEADFTADTFSLDIKIFHRLFDLERGATSWEWIERQWAKRWRPALYKKDRALAADISNDLKAGNHKGKVADRPYVGKAVEDYSDVLADEIDALLMYRLPLRRL